MYVTLYMNGIGTPFQVLLASEAVKMLRGISDRRIRSLVIRRIEALAHDPGKQGKPLRGELVGYRSIRVAQKRYRVIYGIEKDQVRVIVVAVGLRQGGGRRDVYRLAQRLVRLGLVESPNGGSLA